MYKKISNENDLAKLKINGIYQNEFNEVVLRDAKASLELDSDELEIKKLIDFELENVNIDFEIIHFSFFIKGKHYRGKKFYL